MNYYITWRNLPEMWLLFLVIIPTVLLFSYLIYRKERTSASSSVKLLLSSFRSLVILISLLILFQPVVVTEKPITKESMVVLLVDDSLSMSFKDRYSPSDAKELTNLGISGTNLSRIEIVNAVLDNPEIDLLNRLKKKAKIKTYTCSATTKPFEWSADNETIIKAEGNGTGIGQGIQDVVNDIGGASCGGIILLSDGQNNSGVEPLDVIRSLKDRSISFPIYTIVCGNPQSHNDIEISDLSAPDVATVADIVDFRFTLKASGVFRKPMRIILSERGADEPQFREVAEETIKPTKFPSNTTLKYKPTNVGEYIYEIKVLPSEEETIYENNYLEHHLVVVDNNISVLYVESYPRWEYRRLKNALIRDRTMKTSVFLVSADAEFPQESSPAIPPLIRFPPEAKDLFYYDVIIWGDVSPEYLSPQPEKLLHNIKRFVEEMGGGIAFVCGEKFNPRSFRKTILTELIPLSLEDDDYFSGSETKEIFTEAFRIKLTPEGLSDSIMRLEDNPVENTKVWETLPGFFWYYPFKKPKPAARVLAVHPIAFGKFGPRPIIATQYYGAGRSFLITSDETWRWCQIKGDKYFYTFWGEVIRFLRGGRLLGTRKVHISTDKPKYQLSETAKITAKIYDNEFRPLKQSSYTVYLETFPPKADLPNAQGKQEKASSDSESITSLVKRDIILNPVPDKEGHYEGSYTPDKVGKYKIWSETSEPDISAEGTGEARKNIIRHKKKEVKSYGFFSMHYPKLEYEKPLPNVALLKKIAEETQGAFLKLPEINKLPDIVKPVSDVIYTETKEDDLWDTPIVFLLFLIIISAEWVIRKFAGLI
jgi:uncharacterized membrane protein